MGAYCFIILFGGLVIMLKQNDIAPELSLPDIDGNIISMEENLSEGQNVLLVFLRHLG